MINLNTSIIKAWYNPTKPPIQQQAEKPTKPQNHQVEKSKKENKKLKIEA